MADVMVTAVQVVPLATKAPPHWPSFAVLMFALFNCARMLTDPAAESLT